MKRDPQVVRLTAACGYAVASIVAGALHDRFAAWALLAGAALRAVGILPGASDAR